MEKVLLVGAQRGADPRKERESLEELARLTETAGGTVAETITQKIQRFHPAFLIGPGKATQIAERAKELQVQSVIFNEELSPAQQRNLENTIARKILDRTRLILDIFAQRARTREGELQVELAQLNYLLPRLTGRGAAFSQQVGGIGTRGPGERQIEYERRHIRDRISKLKKEIEDIRREREVQRKKRRGIPLPIVSIIGYTNVGKSSLLNRLAKIRSEERIYADDKLFATLDPTTRRVALPHGGVSLFTDTVGFIRKLPHLLVAAFQATLEEIRLSDCLLHVLDATHPNLLEQKRAVEEVLSQIRAESIPQAWALNKADLLSLPERERLSRLYGETPLISAATGEGMDILLEKIEHILSQKWIRREFSLLPHQTKLLDEIYRVAQVLSQVPDKRSLQMTIRVDPQNWNRIQKKLSASR